MSGVVKGVNCTWICFILPLCVSLSSCMSDCKWICTHARQNDTHTRMCIDFKLYLSIPGDICEYNLSLCAYILPPLQFIVGDHLQQEQWGGVTTGAAVLPPAGPAVPGLPIGCLQVCLRVPRLFDRTQPWMGWHQVRRPHNPFRSPPLTSLFSSIPSAIDSPWYSREAG